MSTQECCLQCESNARSNEAGGYHVAAEKCRAYCRRGHVSEVALALRHAAVNYVANAKHHDMTLAFEAGYREGVHAAAAGVRCALPDEDNPPKVET